MKRSESILNLAKSLAAAQGEFSNAMRDHTARVKTKAGGEYSYNYSDLASVFSVIREPMAKNGLSIVQLPFVDGSQVTVVTTLLHESGEWIESEPLVMPLSDDLRGAQSIGSAITYARRYSLSCILGIATEVDDDANSASGNQAQIGSRESDPNAPKCPDCGSPMKRRNGKRGPFYGCTKYPECTGLLPLEAAGGDTAAAKDQSRQAQSGEDNQTQQQPEPERPNGLQWQEFMDLVKKIGAKSEAESDKIIAHAQPGESRATCWKSLETMRSVMQNINGLLSNGETPEGIRAAALRETTGATA